MYKLKKWAMEIALIVALVLAAGAGVFYFNHRAPVKLVLKQNYGKVKDVGWITERVYNPVSVFRTDSGSFTCRGGFKANGQTVTLYLFSNGARWASLSGNDRSDSCNLVK